MHCITLRCAAFAFAAAVGYGSGYAFVVDIPSALSVLGLVWISGFGYDGHVVCGNVGYAFAMCVDI